MLKPPAQKLWILGRVEGEKVTWSVQQIFTFSYLNINCVLEIFRFESEFSVTMFGALMHLNIRA